MNKAMDDENLAERGYLASLAEVEAMRGGIY